MPTSPAPDDFYVYLGARLKELRLEQSKTMAQVARAVGVTHAAIHNLENGNRRVQVHTLVLYCKHMRVDPADILRVVMEDVPDLT